MVRSPKVMTRRGRRASGADLIRKKQKQIAPRTGATGAVFLEAQKQLIVFADMFGFFFFFLKMGAWPRGLA